MMMPRDWNPREPMGVLGQSTGQRVQAPIQPQSVPQMPAPIAANHTSDRQLLQETSWPPGASNIGGQAGISLGAPAPVGVVAQPEWVVPQGTTLPTTPTTPTNAHQFETWARAEIAHLRSVIGMISRPALDKADTIRDQQSNEPDKKLRVLVLGPIGTGGPATEAAVQEGLKTGVKLLQAGFSPLVPHFNAYYPNAFAQPKEFWVSVVRPWIESAQAIVRLPGASANTDALVARAQQLGIAVYDSVETLVQVVRNGRG